MARVKPNPFIVENKEQAEGALAELAQIKRKITMIELEQQEQIDLAKAKANQKAQSLLARAKEIESGVTVYAKMNKAQLFEKAKSLDLGFGIIGFRASTAIEQMRGVTAEMSIEKMHEFAFDDGIKLTKKLNKEAMGGWTAEKLETVGLVRKLKDTFYIEIKEENVVDVG